MKKKNSVQLMLMISLIFFFTNGFARSEVKEFTGKNLGKIYPQYVSKYLKTYSVYELNLLEISDYVKNRSNNAQFVLKLSTENLKIETELNEMRGDDYKAIAMSERGAVELPQTFANTYKGIENNSPSNIVRLTIDETTFEGYIKTKNSWLYFDMLNKFIPGVSSNQIVVYDANDVVPNKDKTCGTDALHNEVRKLLPQINLTGNCHFVEIATEADFEYYQDFSSNADSALQQIRTILNQVEGLYTVSFNVKFILRYQQIWTTVSDPYSGDSLQLILPQFRDWWNSNRTSIARDVTHMFSGRAVLNSTIGFAYIGVVCNTGWRYGCVVNYSPINNATINLSAHELGHNFDANHDPSPCNGSNIMCPYIQSGSGAWSSQSLSEISNYVLVSGSCMTETFSLYTVISGNGIGQSYLKKIAIYNVTLNSSSGAVLLSSSGFGYIEAGTSIVLSPTNANSLGFNATLGSTLLMRISDVTNTCDQLFAAKENDKSMLPDNSKVLSVFPNPFSNKINVEFNLTNDDNASIALYDLMGKKIKTIVQSSYSKGKHDLSFDASDIQAGIYLVVVQCSDYRKEQKVIKVN